MRKYHGILVTLAAALSPTVSLSQSFVPVGPNPNFGEIGFVQSGDAPPNGTTVGAMSSIVLDPNYGPNTIFAASTNGGIFRTNNSGQTWTALTDNQSSLSIASLSLDVTDASGKTLIAGTGLVDNGIYDFFNRSNNEGSGTNRTGLLYSTDGGNNWRSMGSSTLSGESVVGVAARGNTILAATFEPNAAGTVTTSSGNPYGLYSSTNGGISFSLISGSSGLPSGAVSSLIADPTNAHVFYAAVTTTSSSGYENAAVYKSQDDGQTWAPIFTKDTLVSGQSNSIASATNQIILKLSAGPNGSVAVATAANNGSGYSINGLYLQQNGNSAWSNLIVPNVNPGNQGINNLTIQIDQKNTSIVYVAGDRTSTDTPTEPYTVSAYRVQAGAAPVSLTGPSYTANGSTVHADARSFAMDSAGNLYLTTDGGVYVRSQPEASSGVWSGLNGSGLQVGQGYNVGYGANAGRFTIASQDNGASIQGISGNKLFDATPIGGDGVNAVVSDTQFTNYSTYYLSSITLGTFSRIALNSSDDHNFALILCNRILCKSPTYSGDIDSAPIALNRTNNNYLALGGSSIWVGQDTSSLTDIFVNLNLTNLGYTGGNVTKIAYGTSDNSNVLIAGNDAIKPYGSGTAGSLLISTTGLANSIGYLPSYNGAIPTSLVFDQRSQNRFYVADSYDIWGTSNQGTNIQSLTSNFSTTITRPTAVEFINNNGVNALLIGGLATTANSTSQISVADSQSTGNLLNWRLFGSGLPNTLVYQMSYNQIADVLAVSTIGRGIWAIYDLTSNFSQAQSINFGLANNDSNPDASILTNGTNIDTGLAFVRGLNKYGSGTLTISGIATYNGSTNINAGNLYIDHSGSIESSSMTTVGVRAMLSGSGVVGNVNVLDGGVLAPGSSTTIGSLAIHGNLVLDSDPATTVISVSGSNSSKVNVTGTASLGGNVIAYGSFPTAYLPTTKYKILTADSGLNGHFSSISVGANYSFLTPTLGYGSNDVTLGFALTPFSVVGKNINQRNVGNALTLAALGPVNALGAPILNALFLGNFQNAQAVMDTVSGSGLAGVQSTAMQVGEMASSAVSDQIAFWRSGETYDATGVTSQEGNNPRSFMAYAPVEAIVKGKGPINIKGPSQMAASVTPRTYRAWGSMFGGGANYLSDAGRGSAASNLGYYGGLVGVDYQVQPNLLIGAALGGSSANFNVGFLSTNGALTGFHAGLYGSYTMGASYVALNETFSAYNNQTTRKAGGYAMMPYEQLSAGFGSTEFRTRLEGGHTLLMGGLKATPFVAGEIAAYQSNYFAEKSTIVASTFALKNNGQSVNSLPTFIGLRLSNGYTLANGWRVAPIGSVAYVHEFFPQRQLNNILMSMPGADFNVSGPRSTYNLVQTKIGAQLNLTNQFALFSDFQGEYSAVSSSYGGKAGMKYWW